MEKFKFILKIGLAFVSAVWGLYFNIMVGFALINIHYTEGAEGALAVGIILVVAALVGFGLGSVLAILDKSVISTVLVVAGSVMVIVARSMYMSIEFTSNNTYALFDSRNLPSISVTAIVLIIALINLYLKKKAKKIAEQSKKAPSIFSKRED